MSNLLITPQEVINLAIEDKDFLPARIKENRILVAQENYIKPVLTTKLYERILEEWETPADASQQVKFLMDNYIKNALAYYVVYEIIPTTFLQITNKGGQKPNTEFSHPTSKDERDTLRANNLSSGNTFMKMFTEFMETNKDAKTNYPEYEKFENIKNRVFNRGGIIFTSKKNRKKC